MEHYKRQHRRRASAGETASPLDRTLEIRCKSTAKKIERWRKKRQLSRIIFYGASAYLYQKGVSTPLRETGYAFNLSSRQVARELLRYGFR